MITSDAHEGILNAISKVFPEAAWQRCQFHFSRNIIDKMPKKYQKGLSAELQLLSDSYPIHAAFSAPGRRVSLFFCKVILSAFSAPNKACHLFIFIYYHTAYIGNNVICMNVFSIKKRSPPHHKCYLSCCGPRFLS